MKEFQQKRESISKNILKLNSVGPFQNYKSDRECTGAQQPPYCKCVSSHLDGEYSCKDAYKNAIEGRGKKEVKGLFFINNYSNFQRFCQITETAKGKSLG